MEIRLRDVELRDYELRALGRIIGFLRTQRQTWPRNSVLHDDLETLEGLVTGYPTRGQDTSEDAKA